MMAAASKAGKSPLASSEVMRSVMVLFMFYFLTRRVAPGSWVGWLVFLRLGIRHSATSALEIISAAGGASRAGSSPVSAFSAALVSGFFGFMASLSSRKAYATSWGVFWKK